MAIRKIIQLTAIASAFCIFGLFGVLFKIVLQPLIWLQQYAEGRLNVRRFARRMVTASWRLFARYLSVTGVAQVQWVGKERLGKPGQLVLANHPSLLDVVFVLGNMPEANCVVKADLLHNLAMNSQIRACGYLPNRQDLDFADTVHEVLQNECLLIFPEGTRTGWDGEVKFHRGAVALGLRSARVITPVRIEMTPPALKKGQKWYNLPEKTMCYRIIVGEDIHPQSWLAEKPLPIAARRLNSYLHDYFNQRIENE